MRLLLLGVLLGVVVLFAGALWLAPGSKGRFFWEARLTAALTGADRIRVRTGGTCHRTPEEEKTLFEERDPAKVREVIANISINPWESGYHCKCCGEPSIEFYKGEELLLTLGYHHGKSVRWPEGWDGDGHLTSRSAAYLNQWLAAHRVQVP